MNTCIQDNANQIEAVEFGKKVRLWGKQKQLDELNKVLSKSFANTKDNTKDAVLCFMGSGDFHHITALLLPLALAKHPGKATVIHFDNHPDWVNFEGGLHCGSWVNSAVENSQVSKVITIGVCSKDLKNPHYKGANLNLLLKGVLELFPYKHKPSKVSKNYDKSASYQQIGKHIHWQEIEGMGEKVFIDKLLGIIKTKNVYITIDKDVLQAKDAITNWDQGIMTLPFLLKVLSKIGQNHFIIGADVTGDYSVPKYVGGFFHRLKKLAEIFLDQPRQKIDVSKASEANSITNHAILEVLSEVMA